MNKVAFSLKKSRWVRASVSLLISGGLLAILFARLDTERLRDSIADIHAGLMGLAILAYGLYLFLGSLRWRIALNESNLEVPFVVILRASLVGHVFNLAFFGPVGGDLAKTAAYARWHKYEIHDLLATAAIDRSFAVAGSVLMFAVTLAVFLASPAVPELGLAESGSQQARYLLLGLAAALIVTLVVMRLRRRPFIGQLVNAFAEIARELHRSPMKLLAGCLLGFAGKVLSSFMLLIGILAITYPAITCIDSLWSYPIIAAIAALPFSVGGAGLRESAALLFLSNCEASPEQIVAAGLLVLLSYILWGVIGIPVLLWEEYRHNRSSSSPG
jgi:uncharacterized membrane protein YbhN (UPF0104 family)